MRDAELSFLGACLVLQGRSLGKLKSREMDSWVVCVSVAACLTLKLGEPGGANLWYLALVLNSPNDHPHSSFPVATHLMIRRSL